MSAISWRVLIALWLAGCAPPVPSSVVVSPRPGPSAPELPPPAPRASAPALPAYHWCSNAERDASELAREVEAIEVAVADAASDEQVRAVANRINALAEHPCFRLAPKVKITEEESSLLGLRWFWSHGGREWVHQAENAAEREIIVPGPIPEAFAARSSSAWVRAGLACHDVETVCGADTRAWAQRAERAINAIGRRAPYSNLKTCRNEDIEARAYDSWLECRLAQAGLIWILPLGAVKGPADGSLFSTASSRDCVEWRATWRRAQGSAREYAIPALRS